MVRVEVVVREHGREFVYTVAEEPSMHEVRDLVARLRAYFGRNGRIRIVRDELAAD